MLLLCLGTHALPALMRAGTYRRHDNIVQLTDAGRGRPSGAPSPVCAEKAPKKP